jgi:hypothetical protein
MEPARFVSTSTSKLLLLLGLAGFVLGCSDGGGPASTPPDKETSKKIAAEMKRDHLEQKAARQQMKERGPR